MSTTFRLLRVVGDRPADWPAGVVLNAPRPLLGSDVSGLMMGFTVVVEPDRYRRADTLDEDRRLDAQVVEFVPRPDALAQVREYARAEYGIDPESDDALDEDDLLDVWRVKFTQDVIDVA